MHRKATLLAFVASAVLASASRSGAAQKADLEDGVLGRPSHHMVQTQEAWAKTIFDASGGNLVIEIDKAPLAKPDGQYDIVKNGVRDLVWHVPGYTRRPLRPVPGRRAAVPVPELDRLQPRAVEVVREARARAEGVHRHHAGHRLHDRAVRHPSRQARAHARGNPGAQDPRRRRQRAGRQGARLVGGGRCRRPTPTRRCSAASSTAPCFRGRRSTASGSTSSPSSISKIPGGLLTLGLHDRRQHQGDRQV